MSNSQPLVHARSSIGDTAVDGLLHGVEAGIVMALYLLVVGVAAGMGLAATPSAFDLGQGTSPVRGALIHLAVAAIYGMVFGGIDRLIGRRRPIGRGGTIIIAAAFSLVLWLITQIAFAADIQVALSSLPAAHLALAHGIYGVTLGWLTGRAQKE